MTDNGSCCWAAVFREAVGWSRHSRIRQYTPRHIGKAERYNRIIAEKSLYARTWNSEAERAATLAIRNQFDNYHRPHGAHEGLFPRARHPHASATS